VVPAAVDALALVWRGRSPAVILQEGDEGGILLLLLIQPCMQHLIKYEMHCNENPIYVFSEKEVRGRSPNFHIHVYVRDLYYHDRSTYFPAAE
jgi:hypothetical protein